MPVPRAVGPPEMLEAGLFQPPWAQVADGNTEAPGTDLHPSTAIHRLCGETVSLSHSFLIWGVGIKTAAALCYWLNEIMHIKGSAELLAPRKCSIVGTFSKFKWV